MANKAIRSIKLTDTLTISEYKDGYWLYDKTRGMNLSMRAKTEQDAYIDAITYYQKRLLKIEQKHKKLYNNLNNFIKSLLGND